jgi:ATP-dependent Clp protease, protease subunit
MKSRKGKLKKLEEETNHLINDEITLENAKDWLSHGVDFEFRRMDINGDVDDEMTKFIRRNLIKLVDVSPTLPIEIHLSTYGGELNEALAIYDMLQSCPNEIIMVANGKIMSAGLPIFLGAKRRLSYANTRFMMHSLSHKTMGKLKDTEIDVKEGRFLNNVMVDILSKHTNKDKKWWEQKISSHDYFFGNKEAMAIGVLTPLPKQSRKR